MMSTGKLKFDSIEEIWEEKGEKLLGVGKIENPSYHVKDVLTVLEL